MAFSTLLEKWVGGQELSVMEKEELVREARFMEQASTVLNSILRPGTRVLSVEGLQTSDAEINRAVITDAEITNADIVNATITDATIESARAGDVTLNDFGVTVEHDTQFGIVFKDSNGNTTIRILSSPGDQLQLQNEVGPIELVIFTTDASAPGLTLQEDPAQNNRAHLNLNVGAQGAVATLDGQISMHAKGGSGGATYFKIQDTTNVPPAPTNPGIHVYVRNNKIVCQFEDGGTVRYKYLDLSGTGVTWVHTTTPP